MPRDPVPFLAACVQMRSGLDRRRNQETALKLIDEAASRGAQFVVTPEMTNVLDKEPKRLLAGLPDGETLEEIGAFAAAAKARALWLLAGSFAVKLDERRAANRSFLFSPAGDIAARYDKLHMFDVELPQGETWRESNVYEPGEDAVLAHTDRGAMGLTICYDLRFPHLYRALARAGAEILCVPAAFTKQTGESHWRPLLRARAIECGAFVVAAAQGGRHEDGRDTFGHSMIIGPWGDVIAESTDAEPGVIIGEIDLAKARQARARIPSLSLERTINVVKVGA